jgi:endothelin-converting enzyme/putative endopeptidase
MRAPSSRRLILAFTFVSLPLASALSVAQTARPAAPPAPAAASASGLDLRGLNRAVDPCTDFFQFACGGWTANNPIPGDQARWGTFDALQERNNDVLRTVLEAAASGSDPATRKIGDYYASCMDEAAIERKGASPLEPDFQKIAALESASELPALLAALHTVGVDGFFAFGAEADFKDASTVIAQLDQGGLGLPDRDYYFRADARSADIRGQYTDHVGKLTSLVGGSAAAAGAASATVMRLETSLAKAALDNVSRRDPAKVYHKMTPAELQALTPEFNWAAYFRAAGAPAVDVVNVAEPEFLRAFNELLKSAPVEDLKTYLRWHVVHANAFILSSPFVDENFKFYSTTLRGIAEQRLRWKRCVQYTDGDLGEALGQAFVARTFGPKAKADMLDMVRNVESALENDIATLPWMTDATRAQAVKKLRAISNKIGYPDTWRDYGALQIVRGDAFGNSHRANAFEFGRQMNRIGKPLDKTEWGMTPPTVNAYYNPLENNINFPAGILQSPFYNAATDPAVNYGGAGAVIGHELTHGFDDQGRQFDAAGNLEDWWTPADGKAFEERASCFVDQYAGYTAIDDVKLNGKLTLGENTADNGGLRIALMGYLASEAGSNARTLDGFTPEQRVFLGWGQVWCESRRPEYERLQAQTNPHSPGRYRVNGVVSNMPEFQKAFSCKPGAPMVRASACRVW